MNSYKRKSDGYSEVTYDPARAKVVKIRDVWGKAPEKEKMVNGMYVCAVGQNDPALVDFKLFGEIDGLTSKVEMMYHSFAKIPIHKVWWEEWDK